MFGQCGNSKIIRQQLTGSVHLGSRQNGQLAFGAGGEEAVERTGFPKQEMAMVGDRLYTDVATGVNHGMTGILVLSGEAGPEDLETSDVQPDLVFGRLSDMIPYL